MFGYMPYLILLGILAGAIVGGATMLIFKGIPQNVFLKAIDEKKKKFKENG